ncbi:substrate-binding domain-containing protein [Campylobacter concisus]
MSVLFFLRDYTILAKFGAGKRASDFMQKANLEGELKDKILAVAGVTQVVTYILSGEVDAGFINQTGLNAHKDEFGSFILIDKALYAQQISWLQPLS